MKLFTSTVLAVALPALVHSTPIRRTAALTNTQILQFALTLENLENAFYSGGLAKYDEAAFTSAGLPSWARGRFAQIGQHEAAHVAYLSSTLGNDTVAPCNYTFPYTDPASFAALSQILEGVGTSAYLGTLALVTGAEMLTGTGTVATTEARHQSWVASAINHGAPWSGSLDSPLDSNQAYSLAAPFISNCPTSNPPLPFVAFPSLTTSANPSPGEDVQLFFNGSTPGLFLALLVNYDIHSVPITSSADGGNATLPTGLQGMVYAVVTRNSSDVSDDATFAGPAILSFPFDSNASN